jgi:hypothetical protein
MHYNRFSAFFTPFTLVTVQGRCYEGDRVCRKLADRASWCQAEKGTCFGKSSVRCSSEPGSEVKTSALPIASMSFGTIPRPLLASTKLSIKASLKKSKQSNSYSRATTEERPTAAPFTHKPDRTEVDQVLTESHRHSRSHRDHSSSNPFILWTEWPTLSSVSDWKGYFDNLLQFIQSNCAQVRVTRLVMRVLQPEFQYKRGPLWQASSDSYFFKHFMQHLPDDIEVYMYPYLYGKTAPLHWKNQTGVDVPLEGAFKFVQSWNGFLSSSHVPHRIRGLVTDYEDSAYFIHDLHNLGNYKKKYATHGHGTLRFGMAIGYAMVGKIDRLTHEIDDYYLEMYSFYIHGTSPAVKVHAHKHGAHNKSHRFLDILDEKVWAPYIRKYSRYPNVIFMWSIQHKESDQCLYPLSDRTCGERVDFGSWDPSEFQSFIRVASRRHPVFAERQHALFQFSFLPHSWMTC